MSDNTSEVRAALDAGMRAFVVQRPGNPPLELMGNASGLHVVDSFEQVEVRPRATT